MAIAALSSTSSGQSQTIEHSSRRPLDDWAIFGTKRITLCVAAPMTCFDDSQGPGGFYGPGCSMTVWNEVLVFEVEAIIADPLDQFSGVRFKWPAAPSCMLMHAGLKLRGLSRAANHPPPSSTRRRLNPEAQPSKSLHYHPPNCQQFSRPNV